MAVRPYIERQTPPTAIPVESMRTLLVCRGPIAFETLEVYQRCRWQLPHVVVSAKEWFAERPRTAPWIATLPPEHVHYVQEYNDVEAILQIARESQIDAIYPGYGFLAESVTFAARIEHAGQRFIGPTSETLQAVGEKDAAVALAQRLAIPTIPGDNTLIAFAQTHHQEDLIAEAVQRTLELGRRYPGYPIRLKHPAGGGGKGQRVLAVQALQMPEVHHTMRDALARVWAEMGVFPASADARKGVLLELDIPRPLHWEVQLFGDGDTVVHFAARDCSLQNPASQKFIELALYPEALTQALQRFAPQHDTARLAMLQQRRTTLERICAEAVRLGMALRLRSAATVEFLIDQQGAPYFLEVNPRIQVEHAVTEGIARVRGHAISLVELQQRVAAGERLDFQQTDITFGGDAMEVRLNAWHEDLSPVLGGVIRRLHLQLSPALRDHVRVEAGGLFQRREPWLIPSYDANFALIVATGSQRRDTLARMITTLKTALQVEGNTALHTNLHPVLGLLTLMQNAPPGTEFRTDTSLLWMACTAVVMAQKHAVFSLLPTFPRQLGPYDPSRFVRLLRATLEAGFAHPSRLLTYYLKRLTDPAPRPLAALEVLWQLSESLEVPLFEEEYHFREVFRSAVEALWTTLSASPRRYRALIRAAAAGRLAHHADYDMLYRHLQATDPYLGPAETAELIHAVLGWLSVDLPALTVLLKAIESTQLHTCLVAQNDFSLSRPAFLEDEATVAHLHRLLRASLRPMVLRHGELCSPMEATMYHRPEPGAPPFVQIGAEVHVGQTLALLEAMKMFTELISPVDGVLVAILVEDGQGVHTGTPLFKIATHDAAIEATDAVLQQRIDGAWQNRFDLLLTPAVPEASRALLGRDVGLQSYAT